MGTANTIVDNTYANDADFQALCQAYEAALLASGFLAVAPDTGQLDLATVVRPAISTFAGYRMYHAVDALAILYPLFVKVEFGVGTNVTRPMMRCTVAPTSNGAGTLVAPVATQVNLINGAIDGSGTARIFGSGLEESCAWAYVYDAPVSGVSPWLMVGRLISVEDAEPRPVIRWHGSGAGGGNLFASGTLWTDGASSWASMTPTDFYPKVDHPLTSGGDINNTLVYQGTIYRNTETLTPPVITGKTAELPYSDPDASAFSIDIWGENHTFVPIPYGAIQSGSTQRICLPWE